MKDQLGRLRGVLRLFGRLRDEFVPRLAGLRARTARFSWGGPDRDLWLIGLWTILLAAIIAFVPSGTVARIILGLPFLLFFPGYTLTAALFPRKAKPGRVERLALSFGLSIAVVPLIGLVLNFTPWGIRLEPILISLAAFIIAAAGAAWYRREKLPPDERFSVAFNVRLPSWRWHERSLADKVLSVALVVAILGAIGTLGYVVANPRVGESYTEFYILGPNGTAENYPTDLKVGGEGKVIVGIVNHEQEEALYTVEVLIDGNRTQVMVGGEEMSEINVELQNQAKWEQEVGFVPQKAGDNQKVEFVLYKDGAPYFEEPPYLWINVKS
jgi:uncharacterized membrane protein